MKIIVADEKHKKEWNDFVGKETLGGIYHLFEWQTILQAGYNIEPFFLMAVQDGCTCGVLPLVKAPLFNGKSTLISLPYCDFSGVLAHHDKTAYTLIDKAKELAERMRCSLVIRQKGTPLPGESTIDDHNILQLVSVPESVDDIMGSFSSNLRRKIRKSIKNGIDLRRGVDEFNNFYTVYANNMHYLGTPHHSRRFLTAILHFLKDKCEIVVASYNGLPIGGMFILTYKDIARDPWTSTLRRFNNLYPANLLYYNAIKYAVESDIKTFDFGRSQPETGVYNFKKQWGCHDEKLFYHNYSGTLSNLSDSSLMIKASRVWRKLPYMIVLPLGQHLRKFLH